MITMSPITKNLSIYSKADGNMAKTQNESKMPYQEAEFELKELQEQLKREFQINASLLEEKNDFELEWWGHDGSLCSIAFWDDGEVIFYQADNGSRKIYESVKEPSWKTFCEKSSKLIYASIS